MLAVTFFYRNVVYNNTMSAKTTLSEFFKSRGKLRHFHKGQLVYSTGDTLNDVLLIENGLIRIYDLDSFGNERTVSIFGPNHIVPIVWLLEHQENILFFYQALSDVNAYVVSHKEAIDFISNQPSILLYLMDILTKAYINQDSRIFNLQRANVREKLEFVLYHLGLRLGKVTNNIACIPAVITRAEIANLAGCSRESISRELNSITATGLMWKNEGKTYIDFSKIRSRSLLPVYRV